jgi:hypothetical protein
VIEAGLPASSYITADSLSEEYKVPREAILQILDKAGVWPIAKVLNRKPARDGSSVGKPMGGRPKMAFDPQAARAALELGIEEMYK